MRWRLMGYSTACVSRCSVGAGVWWAESGEVGRVLCVDVIRRLVLVII